MQLRPTEITSILKDQIANYESTGDGREVGTVVQVGDGIARVHGLAGCDALEMLEFPNGVMGLALNLEEDNVAAVLLGDDTHDRRGRHRQAHRPRHASVPVGEAPARPRRQPARRPARRRPRDRDDRDPHRSSSRRRASSSASR